MEYQLKPKLIEPAPQPVIERQAIIVNGREIGDVRDSNISSMPIMASLRAPLENGSHAIACGFAETADEAVRLAMNDFRQQADGITRFLAEVDA